MKILWVNRYCLLDTSSGASRSVLEILELLAQRQHEVEVVGATVFDAPVGVTGLGSAWDKIQSSSEKIFNVRQNGLVHRLVKTGSTRSPEITLDELNTLYSLYKKVLSDFKPDAVFYYGGNSFDLLIPIEAKRAGAATLAYLVNANYKGERWADDIDVVVTDSHATAKMYYDEVGLNVVPIGKFIDPSKIKARRNTPKNVTFINPSIEKGGAIVAQLATFMEKVRPDITFEVVESRGEWGSILAAVSSQKRPKKLKNVLLTKNTVDMRPIYSRSRLLLAPSLWWESGARVIAEASINGIPVLHAGSGGSSEMVGPGGVGLRLPAEFHKPPYNKLLSTEDVEKVSNIIQKFFDDEAYYQSLSLAAAAHGKSYHNRDANIKAFEAILSVLKAR